MAREAAEREAGVNLSSIGVLYFQDYTPGAQNQHIADALTEALIDELARVPALEVRSRNAAARFRDSDVPRDSVASALGVGTLVGGLIEPQGDRLKVTVRLFEGFNGNEFRSTSIVTSPDEVLTARDQVVEDVARLLRQWLGEEVRIRAGGQRVANAEAWTLYQRGEKMRKDAEARAREGDVAGAFAALARADSLLSKAALLAPDWPDPLVLQAVTAYRRSRLAHERHDILSWVDRAIERAEGAVRMATNHARALEARGTAKYWKYLQLQAREPEQAQQLLAEARRDLEEAVRIEPTLASAHSVLSHLLTRDDLSSALLAARRAYEADAFLEAAPDVLLRLVTGNYDLENFDQMERWCEEGARRFPHNFRFTDCQLLLLTTRQRQPDVEQAWRLLARLDSLSPENRRAYDRVRGLTMVGGVIGRTARSAADPKVLADSARRVLRRAEAGITHAIDPQQELLPLTAYMYTLLGDNPTAVALLRRYAAVFPDASFEHHWRWRELRGLPEFQPLLVEH
jgi:TolB-like protein